MNNSNNISKFSTQDAYSSQILNQNTSLYSNATAAPLSTPKPLIKTEPNFLSTNTKVQTIATKQLIPKVHTDSEKQLPIPPRDVQTMDTHSWILPQNTCLKNKLLF